jgi:hypothetical protein
MYIYIYILYYYIMLYYIIFYLLLEIHTRILNYLEKKLLYIIKY